MIRVQVPTGLPGLRHVTSWCCHLQSAVSTLPNFLWYRTLVHYLDEAYVGGSGLHQFSDLRAFHPLRQAVRNHGGRIDPQSHRSRRRRR